MSDEPTPQEELQQLIAARKQWIAETESQMAVHGTQFDSKKKGEYCSNRRARMLHKARLDELVKEIAELEARLTAVVNARTMEPVQIVQLGAVQLADFRFETATAESQPTTL